MKRKPRQSRVVEGVLLVAVVVLLYWPYLHLGSLTTGGDMANLFFPVFSLVRDSIANHRIFPLWNPYDFCGHPLAAAAQSAVFYPPGRVIYSLFGGVPIAAMNLFILAHLVWAALGAWAFAKSRSGLGLRGAGPWCAGLAFAGSAWWWGQMEHAAALATTSWLPWLVWSTGMLARRPSKRSVAAFGAVLALQLLAGHPQEAFYSLMAAFAWAVWLSWREGRLGRLPGRTGGAAASRAGRTFGRTVVLFILGCALAALLASIQLLSTFELSARSYRQFDTSDYAAQYSMPVRLLVLLFFPHFYGSYAGGYTQSMAFGEYGIYVGIPVLLLALAGAGAGFVRRRRLRTVPGRGVSVFWAVIAVGAILLAFGGNADLRRLVAPGLVNSARGAEFPDPGWSPLALLIHLVPPVRHFRVPARILILWAFAASLLAARGIRLIEIRIRRRGTATTRNRGLGWATAFSVVCGAAIFFSLFLPSLRERLSFQANYRASLSAGEDMRIPVPGGPSLSNRVFRLTLLDDSLLARDSAAPEGTATDPDLETRVAVRDAILSPDMNLLSRRALLYGYEEGLLPTVRYKDFLFTFNRSFRDADPDARLLALGGVRWLWSELPIRSAAWERVETKGVGRTIGAVYRNTLWRGVAFDKSDFPHVDWAALDGTYRRSGKLAVQRGNVRLPYTTSDDSKPPAAEPAPRGSGAGAAGIPNWKVEVVDVNTILCRRQAGPSSASTDDDKGDTPTDIDGDTTKEGSLIFAQAVYPGWVARDAEGRRLPLDPLNAWDTEIEYTESHGRLGTRRPVVVRLSYEPWSFRLGAFLTALGLALLAALFAGGRGRPEVGNPRSAP